MSPLDLSSSGLLSLQFSTERSWSCYDGSANQSPAPAPSYWGLANSTQDPRDPKAAREDSASWPPRRCPACSLVDTCPYVCLIPCEAVLSAAPQPESGKQQKQHSVLDVSFIYLKFFCFLGQIPTQMIQSPLLPS